MKLFTYFRSSAAYRVRIALNLKGLKPEQVFIHLQKNEQRTPEYLQHNPQGLVPLLLDNGQTISQSLAIIEYLDETHPDPALMPNTPLARARVRSLAQLIACDIHPLNNSRVLHYLTHTLKVAEEEKNHWYRHWVKSGLDALETRLARESDTGRFCHGDQPSMADCCLVPQLFNARRFNVDLTSCSTLTRIETECLKLPAFADAAPDKQPDAFTH